VNVLSNLASFDPRGMAFKIADLYLKDKEVEPAPKKEQTAIKAALNLKR
jgi:hypothetical protein